MERELKVLLTADELAELLQISPRSIWRLLSKGELLPPIRFGGTTRWRVQDVEEWIELGCPASSGFNNDFTSGK